MLGLLIAVPVASGAYMAWKPLSQAVTSFSGRAALAPPRVKLTVPADLQRPWVADPITAIDDRRSSEPDRYL